MWIRLIIETARGVFPTKWVLPYWVVQFAGPVLGAAIAVAIIQVVRGLPDKQEREAAEGGDLPIAEGQPQPSQ